MKQVQLWAKAFPPVTGGVEFYSRQVAAAFNELSTLDKVVTWRKKQDPAPVFEPDGKVETLRGDTDWQCAAAGIFHLLARKKNPNILIFATTWKAAVPAFITGHPYVLAVHGKELYASGIKKYLASRVYRQANAIVCVSNFTRQRLLAEYPGLERTTSVIWNGLTDPQLLEISASEKWNGIEESICFYTICRHEERKNILHAIRLFSRILVELQSRGKDCVYYIAGTGPTIDAEKALVKELGLHGNVIHLGRISDEDVLSLHRRCHVFLHPQTEMLNGRDFEGFGLVIADAMASASLVLAGTSGGAGELISHGVDGLYVSGNSVDASLATLKPYVFEPQKMKHVARAAQKKASNSFRWATTPELLLPLLS